MIKIIITRSKDDGNQTLGYLDVYKDYERVFSCKTLELPDRFNQTNISCIPKGLYTSSPRWSAKYRDHYIINNVVNRSLILIHHGNYKHNTRGCILVGDNFADINKDGYLDVTNSKTTMKNLLSFLNKKECLIQII